MKELRAEELRNNPFTTLVVSIVCCRLEGHAEKTKKGEFKESVTPVDGPTMLQPSR